MTTSLTSSHPKQLNGIYCNILHISRDVGPRLLKIHAYLSSLASQGAMAPKESGNGLCGIRTIEEANQNFLLPKLTVCFLVNLDIPNLASHRAMNHPSHNA